MRLSKMSRVFIMIIMNGLWQACLVKCLPQVYMIGFPENTLQGHAHLRITVTNVCASQINVSIASYLSKDTDTYVLEPAASNITEVPRELMVKGTGMTKKGIKINTTGEATVYLEVNKVSSMEGSMAIPVLSLGSRHYAVTGVSTEGITRSEILLVGVTNQTLITVTIKTTTTAIYGRKTLFNGGIIHIEIDEFDTVQIQSESGDLTGTLIVSSSPISVFSGNQAVSINTNVGYLLEQIPATMLWQNEFVTVPTKGFDYKCKILAASPWTLLRYQCSSVGWHDILMLHAGAYVTPLLGGALCTFTASKPILVTMIIHSTTLDAAMVVLQPFREVHTCIMFHVPETLESAKIIFFTNTFDAGYMTLDNAPLTNLISIPFEPFYTGAVEDIDIGTHVIETSGSSFGISGYILGRFGSQTSAFPLLFQNSSCPVNLSIPSTTTTTTTTTPYINGTVDDPTTTIQNYTDSVLDATTASHNSIYVESSRSETTTTSDIFIGTLNPTNEKGISSSEMPTESTTNERILTNDRTTETTAATVIGKHERMIETTSANFDAIPPAPTTETSATAIATYEPQTKTTSVEVIAPSELTTGTTSSLRTASSQPTTSSTETASETIDTAVGRSETTTVNAERTTVAVVDETPIALSSEPTLKPLGGTTTLSAAEETAITEKSTQEPTISSTRPVVCGTNPWASWTCYKYCANRTRRIVDMRANLIDRKSTNRYLRSLTSALDDRTSARTIGYTGVIVLVAVFLFIVILDVKAGGKSKKRH